MVDSRHDAGAAVRIERKLDRFVDAQSKANELVERRLQRLESVAPDSRAPQQPS